MPRPNPYTPEIEAAILREYAGGASTHELVAKYGGSRKVIVRRLEAAGVAIRTVAERQHRLPIREDAFTDAANDDEAAYWVGMIMADGCVYHQASSDYLQLGFHVKDIDHIRKFQAFLGSSHKIICRSVLRKPVGGKAPVRVDMCEVRIGSRRLVADLAKYGVVPRKSKTATVIGLENNRHFWRGVVDGDGCLRWCARSNLPNQFPQPSFQVVGSCHLMRQLERYSHQVVGSNTKSHESRGCWGFSLTSEKAARMVSHLYTDCTTALDRKWATAHDILCGWELRPQNQKPPKPPPPAICTQVRCTDPHFRRGLCERHYANLRAGEIRGQAKYRAKRSPAFPVPSS